MTNKQKTIAKPATITGTGLHTGLEVKLTINPAPANHGIIFKRIDLPNAPIIHALVENVVETSRGTTLEENGAKVGTIEHVMAAFAGFGIDNALCEITAPEAPIGDGSSSQVVAAIREAGVTELDENRNFYEVKEKIKYVDEEKGIDITIYPDNDFSVNVMIDYNSHVIGNQYAMMESIDQFIDEIAPSRTFVFLHELELLLKHNLIKGGDINNAIVIVEREVSQEELDRLSTLFNKPKIRVRSRGILNNIDLHFDNEPARHKLLDLLGDFMLIGQPLKGRVVATRPGHHANTEMAKIIKKIIKKESLKPVPPFYNPNLPPVLDTMAIMKKLPHRPPFLMVDKITHLDKWLVTGIKNVTMNETHFMGHFPDEPVMPGVLQIEAMAQVAAVLLTSSVPDPENYLTYFLKIENVKFKNKVVPGDTLNIRMQLMEPIKRGLAITRGQAFVGNTLVIEGEFLAQLAKKPAEKEKALIEKN